MCAPVPSLTRSFRSETDNSTKAIHTPSSRNPANALYGPLAQSDGEMLCSSGFVTETMTWYSTLEDGGLFCVQIVHSSVGLWYPTIQFTFKYFKAGASASDPATRIWKSTNVSNFVTPAPGSADKRSCKADEFSCIFTPSTGAEGSQDTYNITANLSTELQLSIVLVRPEGAPGYKVGGGEDGGGAGESGSSVR